MAGLLLLPTGTAAQTPDTAAAAADTTEAAPPRPAGVVVQEAAPDTTPPVPPLVALLQSLVVPGWGQTSVGKPVRGAVYFAAEAASLGMVLKTQAKLSAAQRAEPPDEGLVDARKQQRQDWIVISAFIAFISGLDAWVSAHFWDFEPEVTPPEDGSAGLEVGVRIPVVSP